MLLPPTTTATSRPPAAALPLLPLLACRLEQQKGQEQWRTVATGHFALSLCNVGPTGTSVMRIPTDYPSQSY
jgi:hypothetical protein